MPKTKSKKKGQQTARPDEPVLSKKELAAQKRKDTKERKAFIQTVLTSGGVGAVVAIALFFIANPILALAGGGGTTVLWVSFKYPYLALWLFVIYMPFAGTVTYWIAGGNPIFQLAKDGFAIPAIIAIFLDLKKRGEPLLMPKSLKNPLWILVASVSITMLTINLPMQFASGNPPRNPTAPTPPEGQFFFQGILGIKVLLGYLPLITCTYHMIRNKKSFLLFTRLHVILAIICCGLGLIQYMMLLTGICQGTDHLTGVALFQATLDYKCFVGGSLVYSPSQSMIRLPGTFVAPWQWAWFLISNAFLTFASAFSDPSLIWQLVSFLGMALVFVNAVISGQRIALLLVPVIIIIMLIVTGQLKKPSRFIPIVGGLGLLIVLGFTLFPDVIQERIDSTIDRWNASPPTDFISEQAENSSGSQRPFGHGAGRATNSTRMFADTRLIETYYPKLLYEIGTFGTLSFLGLVTSITVATFKIWRSLKDKIWRSYAASFWVFIFFISYQTYYYPLDVDPVAVYYWMVVGLVLRLPDIEREDLEERAALGLDEEENAKTKKKKRK
ncbi:hormogonium polysaccharide biosynthesis protein HpsL [Phormidium yuhuli AB48]|uniref:Hormogonium polysaccharide biosynthesis protein HpsL n=1 Tax=Phormidium yuhuli AB48 TaxID=2940671 RepID=A0ABY5AQ27_9CYAN|nr:hormogonium polysaccharide biosynthesis protein HpsL [Phormidium yuhuli]USR90876.1 hormogonium polysaccharide biosynthesis protein HpsL [Phormidium yuhuli AB48]